MMEPLIVFCMNERLMKKGFDPDEQILYEKHLAYYRPYKWIYRKNMDRLYITNKRIYCRSWLPLFSKIYKPLSISWTMITKVEPYSRFLARGFQIHWMDEQGNTWVSLFIFPLYVRDEIFQILRAIIPHKVFVD